MNDHEQRLEYLTRELARLQELVEEHEQRFRRSDESARRMLIKWREEFLSTNSSPGSSP